RDIQPANRDEVLQLGLAPAASVTRLKRLRLADGIVRAVENSTFPATIVPDPQAIGDSLYSSLEQRGTPIVRALQHFRAVNATD
ncbi:UTRA domain-containing protein, partial [Burkholderia pseudomallei]